MKGDEKEEKKEPNVHKDLKGFDIQINEFGQIETRFAIDKLNKFLNEHVDDKKLTKEIKSDSDNIGEEE